MSRLIFITVVRDPAMYASCLEKNPHANRHRLAPIDNRADNRPIPVRYNAFLDTLDDTADAWLIFCHEDFEPLEDALPLLEHADRNSLHGPIGARIRVVAGLLHLWQIAGHVETCEKDGTNPQSIGHPVPAGTLVDTFDCQCLIVHTSLIARHALRFDEKLPFDLYVEDFCIQAMEHHGIASRILPWKSRHWSIHTAVPPSYAPALAYLNSKRTRRSYAGTSSYIGQPNAIQRLNAWAKGWIRKIWR
ncbi:MAG: hypothetical protein ACOX9C_07835 [Kiritimatiellia bacterium]|jgi:hypothetical protein